MDFNFIMHLKILKPNRFAVILTIIGLAYAMIANIKAQTTNSIPKNIFLTDDGKVFWYKSGQRLIDVRKIEAAQNSSESRPASEDPEGHWGQATNGFQLSLRFERRTFTNGETIVATVLMRNITDRPQTYFRPIQIVAIKDGNVLKRKDNMEPKQITVSPETTLFPQTQHKYKENLSQIFDLAENGEYIFQAVSNQPNVTSQKVSVLIVNQ